MSNQPQITTALSRLIARTAADRDRADRGERGLMRAEKARQKGRRRVVKKLRIKAARQRWNERNPEKVAEYRRAWWHRRGKELRRARKKG